MLDKKLRVLKDRLMNILIGRWAEKINPDSITWSAFTAGLACAASAAAGSLKTALALWTINRILDGLDGAVARSGGRQSDRGAYLDIITDFTVYTAIPLALAYRDNSLFVWQAAAVLIGMFYINAASWMYLSALIEKRKKHIDNSLLTSIEMPAGIVEGSETIIFYSLFFILPSYIAVIFIIMAALTFMTVIQRVSFGLRYLSD